MARRSTRRLLAVIPFLAYLAVGCTSTSTGSATAPVTGGATASLSPPAPAPDPAGSAKVWGNPNTMVYHCQGTGAYGLHPQGKERTQAEAQKLGYRPAFGKACIALPVAAEMALRSSSTTRAGGKKCGVERWPVKTLLDDDKGSINFTPVDASVADLVSIPRPDQQPPQSNRIAPTELKVFRVRALLTLVKKEKDNDYHLVLADTDDPDTTIIAEIPLPACAAASSKKSAFEAARVDVDALLATLDGGIPEEGLSVEVEGVGFFDFLHGQTGVAPNGIELHPVLKLKALNQ